MVKIRNFRLMCKIDDENQSIVCNPKWEEKGREMTVSKPIIAKLDQSTGKARIIDTGDAKDEVLEHVTKKLERRML